jgi:hypothetical protein
MINNFITAERKYSTIFWEVLEGFPEGCLFIYDYDFSDYFNGKFSSMPPQFDYLESILSRQDSTSLK